MHLTLNNKPFAQGKKQSFIQIFPSIENNTLENKSTESTYLDKNLENADLILKNKDPKQSIWLNRTITGIKKEKTAVQEGFKISKMYYHLDGRIANIKNIKQGERLLVFINGRATTQLPHRAMLVDLLPAGFEIDSVMDKSEVGRILAKQQFTDLIKDKKAEIAEVRYEKSLDDRFITALDIQSDKKQQFYTAYLIRAVTPGTYTLPGTEIFDMYDSFYHANTEQNKLIVKK